MGRAWSLIALILSLTLPTPKGRSFSIKIRAYKKKKKQESHLFCYNPKNILIFSKILLKYIHKEKGEPPKKKPKGVITMFIAIQKEVRKFRSNRKGFTLTEMLVVIAIIASLVVVGAPHLLDAIQNSKRTVCEADIKVIGDAVMRYYTETGTVPDVSNIDGLKTELTRTDLEFNGRKIGPFVKENMNTTDPWGKAYEWKEEGGAKYDICSQGAPEDNQEICYNNLGKKSSKS